MAERYPGFDALSLFTEPFATAVAWQRMQWELATKRAEYLPSTIPTILIPGALGSSQELAYAKKWFQQIGNMQQVDIARIATAGPILPQVDQLISQLEHYDQPVRLVGYSLGGPIALLAAMKRPDLVDTIVALDSPLVPVRRNHFNFWATLAPVNDLLTNPEINHMLAQPTPQQVRIISFFIPHDGIIAQEVSQRPGAEMHELKGIGHHGMYFNTDACRTIAEALASTRLS